MTVFIETKKQHQQRLEKEWREKNPLLVVNETLEAINKNLEGINHSLAKLVEPDIRHEQGPNLGVQIPGLEELG